MTPSRRRAASLGPLGASFGTLATAPAFRVRRSSESDELTGRLGLHLKDRESAVRSESESVRSVSDGGGRNGRTYDPSPSRVASPVPAGPPSPPPGQFCGHLPAALQAPGNLNPAARLPSPGGPASSAAPAQRRAGTQRPGPRKGPQATAETVTRTPPPPPPPPPRQRRQRRRPHRRWCRAAPGVYDSRAVRR